MEMVKRQMRMDNIFIINHEAKLFSNRRNLYNIEALLIDMVDICWCISRKYRIQ